MARPDTNHAAKKAEILAGALKSFARYGYEGTSNKTIAQEGDFKSPALIYHYFPGGKPELFVACIEQFQPLQDFGHLLQSKTDEPPEIYLRHLAEAYLKLTMDATVQSLLKLVMTEGLRFPEIMDVIPQRIAPLILTPLITYLDKQVEAGRIAPKPPLSMVLQFFGPLFLRRLIMHIGIEERVPVPIPTDEEMIESLVSTFLHGIWRDETSWEAALIKPQDNSTKNLTN